VVSLNAAVGNCTKVRRVTPLYPLRRTLTLKFISARCPHRSEEPITITTLIIIDSIPPLPSPFLGRNMKAHIHANAALALSPRLYSMGFFGKRRKKKTGTKNVYISAGKVPGLCGPLLSWALEQEVASSLVVVVVGRCCKTLDFCRVEQYTFAEFLGILAIANGTKVENLNGHVSSFSFHIKLCGVRLTST
jgi:hypothetical protein